jgi:hypothetical protein
VNCSDNVFTEPLPSNDRGNKCRHRDWQECGSGIQKLIGGGENTHTQTAWRSHKPTLIFPK